MDGDYIILLIFFIEIFFNGIGDRTDNDASSESNQSKLIKNTNSKPKCRTYRLNPNTGERI